jgi:cytochrome c oxidase assembly protein subunit 15
MQAKFYHKNLHWFAIVVVLAALALVGLGGMVTSKGVGMAVPDWPNTYGYNMFLFPPSQWVGGIFYEHTHRLLASGVGLLTTIMAMWIWMVNPGKMLRWLGVGAFVLVVLQGVLGGLRVVLDAKTIANTTFGVVFGVFHGCLGQVFLVLLCVIALMTSRCWTGMVSLTSVATRRFIVGATMLIAIQLVIGATMRHQHAGLAISDFPLAHGQWWPDMSHQAVARYNSLRVETTAQNSITVFQVALQMAHRIVAVLILTLVAICCQQMFRDPVSGALRRLGVGWLLLILTQAGLGAWTIWSDKAADVATLHVVCGALSLVTGSLLSVVVLRGNFRSCDAPEILASNAARSGRTHPDSGKNSESVT